MAISVTHATTAVGTEAGDGEIGKDEWNASHSLSMATDRILGRTTAGTGTPEELTAGSGLTLASGSLDVAGYKYLGRITKSTGTTIVSDISTGDFVNWQQNYQKMKFVLSTTYTSNMYWSLFWKNGTTTINCNASYAAFGNTGSYPRTTDYVGVSYVSTIWYTYHASPVVICDLASKDGTTIADTVVSAPRLLGKVMGHGTLYWEEFYSSPNSTSAITGNGLYITTSTSSADTTLDAWGM